MELEDGVRCELQVREGHELHDEQIASRRERAHVDDPDDARGGGIRVAGRGHSQRVDG